MRESERYPSANRGILDKAREVAVPPEKLVPRRVASPSPVTPRAVILGLILIPPNAWWVAQIEFVRYSDNSTTSALFFNVVALLLLLIAANAALARFAPRLTLTRAELLVVYIMVTAATVMAAHDQLQILVSTLAVIVGRATPENQWALQIHPYLPRHLVVMERAVVDPLFEGGSSLLADGHWRAWLGPLAWWTLFALLLVWVMFCLISLLRRQWDAEHLNYPIAEVPLSVTTEGFLGQKLLWAGACLGATPQLVNLLHAIRPAIPEIPVGGHYFAPPDPWGQVYMLNIPVYSFPFIYGLAYLLPVQLMSSYLIFLALSRVELALAVGYGYRESARFPYVMQQATGACIGLALVVLWAGRGHLKMVWRSIWGRLQMDDSEEALPYRAASLGLVLGLAALAWFLVFAGMRLTTAGLYLSLFFMTVLAVARIRAELGLPTFELYRAGADQVLERAAGDQAWSRNELSVTTLLFWLTRTHRQFPIQSQADALRIGRRSRISLRGLTWAIMLASGFGIVMAFAAILQVTYQTGFDSARFNGPGLHYFGMEPALSMMESLQMPEHRDWGTIGAYLFGAGFTVFLGVMRTRLLWWPFHPIGYLASGSVGVYRLWLPIFVTWLVKSLLLRYGGLKSYRRALPLFLGLILGEFGAGFLRTLVDLAFGLYLPADSGIGGL